MSNYPAAGFWPSVVIRLDIERLGNHIHQLIVNRGQLRNVLPTDLTVYAVNGNAAPVDVSQAVSTGTKFFDAVYYLSCPDMQRPALHPPLNDLISPEVRRANTVDNLLWCALFLMLRGGYGLSTGKTTGTDIPNFLKSICSMNVSPKENSDALASFDINKVPPTWIKLIRWSEFAPEIRMRLSLGLSGYRMFAPFKYYKPKQNASQEALEAYQFVQKINNAKFDYSILPATRSASMTQKFGSLNHVLGQLLLACYTPEQLGEMVKLKMIFQLPTLDPRYNNWQSWKSTDSIELIDPIGLD